MANQRVCVSWAARFLGGALATLAVSGEAADFVMMTAPLQPVAGHPWSVVFAATTLQGRDLNPATGPEVVIAGDRIRIRPRAECTEPSCDVLVKNVFRADVPAVPAGRYTVEVVNGEQTDFAFAQPFTVDVVGSTPPERVRAVDGFWSEPRRPGRGFALYTRGSTMGVGLFDSRAVFQQFEPIWQLDAPTIRGDSVVAAPRRQRTQLANPACIGCAQSIEPEQLLSTLPLRLRFESERRARLDLGDGTVHALVSLPFGVPYVPVSLTDTVDAEFGTLPLPDLQGRWLFDLPQGAQVLTLSAARVEGAQVVFSATGFELICTSATSTQRAGCGLQGAAPAFFARLGDVSERRMRFRSADGSGFYAEKLQSP